MNTKLPPGNSQSLNGAALTQSTDWPEVLRPRQLEDWLLLAETSDWLEQLPLGVRPVQLHRKFARIANKLCKLWNQSVELHAYFDSLLLDSRPGRKGFPDAVLAELVALNAFSFWKHCGLGDDGAMMELR